MTISFEFNHTEIERKIQEQLNFALVRTYTKAAKAAQKAVQNSMPQRFVLRNNFVLNSIRTEAATKRNPVAIVFVPTDKNDKFNADFLLQHETGGMKKPKGKHLALPTDASLSGRGIVTKSKRPKVVLEKPKVFKIDEKTNQRYRHGRKSGIFIRIGRGKQSKIKRLFSFIPRAKVDARFKFNDTALKTIQDKLPGLFEDSLVEALKTAR